MDIKALLAKIAKGETLTTEELAFVAAYDPERAANSAAAAARKKAEADLKTAKDRVTELESQLADAGDAGKTELEKLQKQVEKLTKTLADKEAVIAKATADQKKTVRDGKIAKILSKFEVMPGVDVELARMGLERALADVGDDDLDGVNETHSAVSEFVSKSPGLFVGDKGGGNGTPPKDGSGNGSGSVVTVDGIRKMDDATFLKQKDALWAAADKIK